MSSSEELLSVLAFPDLRQEVEDGIQRCEGCHSATDLRYEPRRTAYDPEPLSVWKRLLDLPEGGLNSIPDPNGDLLLCRRCAEEHHHQMDERWDEYHRGLL